VEPRGSRRARAATGASNGIGRLPGVQGLPIPAEAELDVVRLLPEAPHGPLRGASRRSRYANRPQRRMRRPIGGGPRCACARTQSAGGPPWDRGPLGQTSMLHPVCLAPR